MPTSSSSPYVARTTFRSLSAWLQSYTQLPRGDARTPALVRMRQPVHPIRGGWRAPHAESHQRPSRVRAAQPALRHRPKPSQAAGSSPRRSTTSQVAIKGGNVRVTHDELPTVRCNSSQSSSSFRTLSATRSSSAAERPPEIHVGAGEPQRRDSSSPCATMASASIRNTRQRSSSIFQRLNTRGSTPGPASVSPSAKKIVGAHNGTAGSGGISAGQGSTFFFNHPGRSSRGGHKGGSTS